MKTFEVVFLVREPDAGKPPVRFDERGAETDAFRAAPRLYHCLAVVEERVKPYRQRKNASGEFLLSGNLPHKWWLYNRARLDMFEAISGMSKVLVRPEVSNTHAMVFVGSRILISNVVCVFVFQDDEHFSVLQSSVHECWARLAAVRK